MDSNNNTQNNVVKEPSGKKVAAHFIALILSIIIGVGGFFFYDAKYAEKFYTLAFESTCDKDLEYQVFYSTSKNGGFHEETSIRQMVSKGNQAVKFTINARKIYNLRLDFGSFPGKVTVKNLRLVGSGAKIFNKGEELQPLNFSEFKVDNTVITAESNHEDPQISTKTPVNISGQRVDGFDIVDYLMIVAFVAFLFFIFDSIFTYFGKKDGEDTKKKEVAK